MEAPVQRFTAFDLQRHVVKVQHAAMAAPVAITHHGRERLVMMDYETRWAHGRGDALADIIKRLQANRAVLRREGIAGVSVFGSVARGDAREDSDVDLLIEPAAASDFTRRSVVDVQPTSKGKGDKVAVLILNAAAAVFAFLAAGFWLWSAVGNPPPPLVGWGGAISPNDPFIRAFRRSMFLNRLGAFFAGLSALTAGAAIAIPLVLHG